MSIRVRGRKQLAAKFKTLPDAVQAETMKAVVKSAEELAAGQRAIVPVDQGDLRDSIEVTGPGETTPPYSQPGGSRPVPPYAAAVTVGNTRVRYGHIVEYGSQKMQAQPYFWPAYRLLRRRMSGRISRAGSKALKTYWKR